MLRSALRDRRSDVHDGAQPTSSIARDIAAAKVATPGETLIEAVMAAIVMFSKAAALEVKREGVRIKRSHSFADRQHPRRRTDREGSL
jgi:NAD(P)-dependent dehydrogenase (short-subunit alcohol dehydrogenase family)